MKKMNPRLVEWNNHEIAIPSIKYVKILINNYWKTVSF